MLRLDFRFVASICIAGDRGEWRSLGQEKVSAALNVNAVQAGQQAAVAVVLEVGYGMHAQSHTPLESYLIPLVVKVDDNAAIESSSPIYPTATIVQYPALGMLSVYQGRVIVYVPIRVNENAQRRAI